MDNEPITLVIFGASGDLTARKLIPSLYRLRDKDRLPASTRVVGVSRTPMSHEQFRDKLAAGVREFARDDWSRLGWEAFSRQLFYVPGDAVQPEGLEKLKAFLAEHEGPDGGNRLYYLSVMPQIYPGIVKGLGGAGMTAEKGGWKRLVIEKPFGRDLASARELNEALREHFREAQIYRIDHYLGKETVQNILVFRFANAIFEPVWNHNYIDHVQITVAESVPVGGRGDYYDKSGVLRDMIQNHLMQVLTLVALEAPSRYAAEPLRNEKIKVLDAVNVPTPEEAAGMVCAGQYAGYLKEKGVAADSRTPTFAAVRLLVDNWRWRGVPFYLRSGKGLAARSTEVVIQFHCPPHLMFPLPAGSALQCNRLTLCVQPDEGIRLSFQTKVPDEEGTTIRPADLDFYYHEAYPEVDIPEAYERLLQDALKGDASLFMRSDEIERAWEIMDPLIAASERPDAPRPQEYAVGSDGPDCAHEFLARDGRAWQSIRRNGKK